jgi:dihydrofolate synthase/folylpolyglutamate synthase
MTFQESEAYLLSLGNEVSTMKLGLENIERLLAALGNPETKYLKVQVAGTNGKGSVCAFLNSICLEAGIETGMYTSPHLVSITERVQINGIDISEDEFARLATHVREMAEKLLADGVLEYRPTFFEQVTAIALLAFAEAKVELAILETGLGGRLDATTAANAEIAAITRIDYDHQNYLGDMIEEIAAEKAAIIRADSEAVIIGEQAAEAEKVIFNYCKQLGISPRLAAQVRTASGSDRVIFETDRAEYEPSELGLLGRHQIGNAKIAIPLAEALQQYFPITRDNIVRGLENAHHPGRLEYVGQYLLDGAHNIAGAKALADFLEEFEERPVTMIYGTMQDKDVGEVTKILFPKVVNLILTTPENSRAMPAAEITKYIPADANGIISDSVADALSRARNITGEKLIVITGSLYLVGEVKKILNN